MSSFDVSYVRSQFPALALEDGGRPIVYFDGPGGTQVPQGVIDAMNHYLIHANANFHGAFRTSIESDRIVNKAHSAMADFLNAPSPDEIIFDNNMTSSTFKFSRAIGRTLKPGDEIIVTRLDHSANRSPWIALEELGIVIRQVDFDAADCTLRMDQLAKILNPRTRVVAVGYASNAVGTVNPIAEITRMAHEAGAWIWVDAVHYAPHGPIDVQALAIDFLVCSSYKFFGPHAGVVWARRALLDQLDAYKLDVASDAPPTKFETGTQNFEGQAGVLAAIEHLADIGEKFGGEYKKRFPGFMGRRLALKQAMAAIEAYERALFEPFVAGLLEIPGLTFYGIIEPARFDQRTPTAAFTLTGYTPRQVAEHLAKRGVYVWDGNFYALAVTERLGIEDAGGLVRVGLAHYSTAEEVAYCLACLRELA